MLDFLVLHKEVWAVLVFEGCLRELFFAVRISSVHDSMCCCLVLSLGQIGDLGAKANPLEQL